MKKCFIFIFAVCLICIIFHCPVKCAENHREYADLRTDSAYLKKVCAAALKLPPQIGTKYLSWNNVKQICRDVVYGGKITLTNDEYDTLCIFIDWCYDVELNNQSIYSAAFRKVGMFLKDITQWYDELQSNAVEIVEQIEVFILNNIGAGGVDASGAIINVTDSFVDSVKKGLDRIQQFEDEKFCWYARTYKWSEISELYDIRFNVTPKNYYLQAFQNAMQYADVNDWDLVLLNFDDNCDHSYHGYRYSMSHADSFYLTYWYSDAPNTPFISSPPYIEWYEYFENRGAMYDPHASGTVSRNTSYYVKFNLNEDCVYTSGNNPYDYYFFVSDTQDFVKIYKSLDLVGKDEDYTEGNPKNYYSSGTYDTYNTSNDNSFRVSGDYLSGCSTEYDYSTIDETVLNGDDYSGSTISYVTNNYYSDVHDGIDDNGGNGSGDGGGGSGDGLSGVAALLDGLGTFINSILELLGGIIGIIGNVLSGFIGMLGTFTTFGDDFGEFIGREMTFIPPEGIAVIVGGISAMVTIGVLRAIGIIKS